ncbi:MAG: diguanylate cyclase, partial [Ketobacteraceae bacterium]|nr:diguanylate cyclase [Ketobacteraceae bacterium]
RLSEDSVLAREQGVVNHASQEFYRDRWRLRFIPEIEARFRKLHARKQKRYTRLLLTVLIILYVLFGACDYYILGEDVLPVWAIRYLIGLPGLLFCYVVLRTRWVERFYQGYLVFALALVVITTYWMLLMVSGDAYHLYTSSILAMVMGGLTLTRIGFIGALATAVIYILASVYTQYAINGLDKAAVYYLLLGLWAVMFCVVSAFSYEKSNRKEFLQRILIQRKNNQLKKANERLKNLVDVDALTGISNRRHFDRVLDEEWRRAKRRHYPLALLMVDIDFFKAYNDGFGHIKGDKCLRKVAQNLLSQARRPGDLVARYGGEEFSVILPALDRDEALSVAENFCQKIAEMGIPHPDSDIADCVTVSIGVAVEVPDEHNERGDLLKQADDALYLAKKRGRNRVEVLPVSVAVG